MSDCSYMLDNATDNNVKDELNDCDANNADSPL